MPLCSREDAGAPRRGRQRYQGKYVTALYTYVNIYAYLALYVCTCIYIYIHANVHRRRSR